MKNTLHSILAIGMFTILSTFSVSAFANTASEVEEGVQLGNLTYAGDGCPAGSASIVLSPDQKTMILVLDRYLAEAGKNTGKKEDRKSCNMAIPVHIPKGKSIKIAHVLFKGSTSLPSQANSKLLVQTFFAGGTSPTYCRSFRGPHNEAFQEEIWPVGEWSKCGADTNIRLNTSAVVRTNSDMEPSSIGVEQISELKLEYRDCN